MANNQISRYYKFDDGLLRENRNLKRIVGNEEHHREKRFRLQHTGYIDTLSVLTKMPATEHDPRSFKLDVSFFSVSFLFFLFKLNETFELIYMFIILAPYDYI